MREANKFHPLHSFWCAMVVGVVIFLPFLLMDQGYFIYYGDFNVQQIPFYRLAHEAVRSGNIGWSWLTDLGANFVGSYSFYLLFSPFFWLTLPFPTDFVPHLMAPLLILKSSCAALTAALYLGRFLKDKRYAVIGGLLYAYSGWMFFNIFFNHFHDVAVFFPLLLWSLERLVKDHKPGVFAMMVAVGAMVNYWFFIGEAVFVALYVIVRGTDKSWGLTPKKFLLIAVEAVLGVGISAFALLPSALSLLGNPRTGVSELLTGWNLWLYWHEQRQPAILQSLFFPPELPARPNFFPDHGAKWSSLSGWLPLFSITGVLAYFFGQKRDWLKKILALSLLFALVPGLNSLFILLNHSYYARWFYMPLLLMALATCRALENNRDQPQHFPRAIKWTAVGVVAFIAMCGLTPNFVEEELRFGMADNQEMFWLYAALAMLCLAVVSAITIQLRESPRARTFSLVGIMVVCSCFGIFYLVNGKNDKEKSQWLIHRAINDRDEIVLPQEPWARSDVYDSIDNIAMYWGLPNIQAFHSIVPTSIMEFYPEVGVKRDVGSRPEPEAYAVRPLLSVRWLFIEEANEEQAPMQGYTYYDTQNGFNIYENQNFIPFGFTYDAYVTADLLQDVAVEHRANLMLRAVVLEDDDAARKYGDLLMPLPNEGYFDFSEITMAEDADRRRRFTADRLDIDNGGFTVKTSFDAPQFLFLSVPWEKGWSAYQVENGQKIPLEIEKSNIGFMGVPAPAGEGTIRFDYETPGLFLGIKLSCGTLILWGGYLLIAYAARRRKKPEEPQGYQPDKLITGEPQTISLEEFETHFGDKRARAIRLQQALNQAGMTHIEDELQGDDRTLNFTPPDADLSSNSEEPNGSGGSPNG